MVISEKNPEPLVRSLTRALPVARMSLKDQWTPVPGEHPAPPFLCGRWATILVTTPSSFALLAGVSIAFPQFCFLSIRVDLWLAVNMVWMCSG